MLDEIDQVKNALGASRMKAQRDAWLIEEYRTKPALLMPQVQVSFLNVQIYGRWTSPLHFHLSSLLTNQSSSSSS